MHKIRFAFSLSLILAATAGHAQGADPVPPELLFERLAPSVWTLEAFDAQDRPLAGGSAVVIGPGRLVTACDTLVKARRIAVTRDNVSYGGTLEQPDPERNLCGLHVKNFAAPAVSVASAEGMKPASRVYAIGSPRGQDPTIADGLLTALRRGPGGELAGLQVSVPLASVSSGGGLFDNRGRLIGITTQAQRDPGVHLVLPASWIAELPQRAEVALANRTAPATAAASAPPAAATGAPHAGQVFEYRLVDKVSGKSRPVIYRLDRIDGDKLVFNGGARVERAGGGVVALTTAIGGDFDLAMPPGGWVASEPASGTSWDLKYTTGITGQRVEMKLHARAVGASTIRIKDRDVQVMAVEFTGYTERNAGVSAYPPGPPGRYRARVWFAPELGRVVHFEAKTHGAMTGSSAFFIDEQLDLVDIRSE